MPGTRSGYIVLGMRRDEVILKAAEDLFSQRSYAAVGVAEIGKRAGISGPAIYKHFGSKDEILAVLLERSAMKLLLNFGLPREDPAEDLATIVAGHVDFVLTDPKLASIWVREARSLDGEYARRMARMDERYTERVLTAMRRRFQHRSDADLRSAIWMMIYQLSSLEMWPPEARKTEGLRALMIDLALSGLSALDKPGTVPRSQSA
jgi:AcrR family transcriptional regulator